MSSTKIKDMYLFDIPKRSAISSYVFFSMSMLITQTLETNLFFLNKYIKMQIQMYIVITNTIYSNRKIFSGSIYIYRPKYV
jgi:hypothetical protein